MARKEKPPAALDAPPGGKADCARQSTFSIAKPKVRPPLNQLVSNLTGDERECIAEIDLDGPLYRDGAGWSRRGLRRHFSLSTLGGLQAARLVEPDPGSRLALRLSALGKQLADRIVDRRRSFSISNPGERPPLNKILRELSDEERACLAELNAGGPIYRDGSGWRSRQESRRRFSLGAVVRLHNVRLLETAPGVRLSLRLSEFGRQAADEIAKRADRTHDRI